GRWWRLAEKHRQSCRRPYTVARTRSRRAARPRERRSDLRRPSWSGLRWLGQIEGGNRRSPRSSRTRARASQRVDGLYGIAGREQRVKLRSVTGGDSTARSVVTERVKERWIWYERRL